MVEPHRITEACDDYIFNLLRISPNIKYYPLTKQTIKNLRSKYIDQNQSNNKYTEWLEIVETELKKIVKYLNGPDSEPGQDLDVLKFL